MGPHRRSFGLVVLLLSGAANGTVGAQSVQKHPPVFGADVTLVAVPVFVTDRSGKAVPGLSAEDFEVYDGGRRVPIAAFQAIDVDVPLAAGAELPVAVQAAAPRQFLLLFDLQFSPPTGITRARAAAIRFVKDSLGPSDLVAVATFGRGGLKMLTNFTSDRAYVARAIEGLGLVQSLALASDPLGLSGEFEVPAAASGNDRAALAEQELAAQLGYLRADLARGYVNRVVDFLVSVKQLVHALSSLRGRKQVVLFSGGFAETAWTPQRGMVPDPKDSAVRHRMQDVFRLSGESDVVVHAVDVGGLEGPVDVSSWDGLHQTRGAGRGALAAMAQNTGGRSILPTNDFGRALQEVDEISRHYYVLAFQAAEAAAKPGRPRSLNVRVHGAGLSVSHRATYLVPAANSGLDAAAARLQASEAVAKGLSGGSLSLQLVALPYQDREGGSSIPAVLTIGGPALAAAARGERLEVQVYGYAVAGGRVLDALSLETTLDLSKLGASVRSEGLRVLTTFAAAPGAVELRFFVRAGAAGETGSIRRQLDVPEFYDAATVLSAPLLTLPPAGRIAIPMQTRNRPPLEIPFRLGSEPLRIEGAPRVIADPDGFDRYLVTVVPPQAPAGAYALRLKFRDSGTGLTLLSETGVVLEKS